ncbi:hypothetical protein RhiirA1_446704 [Rhizophagus irregularis]|uniref:Uncharacterized protein n=1 Tax=Rhizophagus irregularis TaxID=588596 RepID=A0A2N0QXY3_9GLOM|nr:hypothetical protein RhiirA1_446704 [Rhizophagus irregularis]
MILSRIKSFQSFSRKIKEAKELQQVPLNNKMKDENQELILSENKSLENQIVGLADNKSQIGNSVSLEDESRDTQELKKRENENLKTQVKELIKENSKQQAALDNLTNVFWNDDESHNSKKLIQDITDLQDMLTDFTMVQGSDYKINNNEANSLLRAFKCEVNCPSSRASLVLGFLLQRITIAKIIEEVEKYLNGFSKNQEMTLERDIVNTTETLINQIILFEKNLKGEDDTTKITPIKIRQNVYSALSHRGFPSGSLFNQKHSNFKTQASVPTYKFFDAGQALEPHLMKGAFGNDESKKLEVEICGFPCIGIFTGDKLSDRIFIKAQIIPRSKRLS